MKSNVSLVIQGVHFCLQQLLTCMNVGTYSTVSHEALTLEKKEREIGRARAHDRSMLFTVQY